MATLPAEIPTLKPVRSEPRLREVPRALKQNQRPATTITHSTAMSASGRNSTIGRPLIASRPSAIAMSNAARKDVIFRLKTKRHNLSILSSIHLLRALLNKSRAAMASPIKKALVDTIRIASSYAGRL